MNAVGDPVEELDDGIGRRIGPSPAIAAPLYGGIGIGGEIGHVAGLEIRIRPSYRGGMPA